MNPNVPWIISCYACGRSIESKRQNVKRSLDRLTVADLRRDYLMGLMPETVAKNILSEIGIATSDASLILNGIPSNFFDGVASDGYIIDWKSNLIETYYKIPMLRQRLSNLIDDGEDYVNDVYLGKISLVNREIGSKMTLKEIRHYYSLQYLNDGIQIDEIKLTGHLLTEAEISFLAKSVRIEDIFSLLKSSTLKHTDAVEILDVDKDNLHKKVMLLAEQNFLNGKITLEQLYELTSTERIDGNIIKFTQDHLYNFSVMRRYANLDDQMQDSLQEIWKQTLLDDRHLVEEMIHEPITKKLKYLQQQMNMKWLSESFKNKIKVINEDYLKLAPLGVKNVYNDINQEVRNKINNDLNNRRYQQGKKYIVPDDLAKKLSNDLLKCGVKPSELDEVYQTDELLKETIQMDEQIKISLDSLAEITFDASFLGQRIAPSRQVVDLALKLRENLNKISHQNIEDVLRMSNDAKSKIVEIYKQNMPGCKKIKDLINILNNVIDGVIKMNPENHKEIYDQIKLAIILTTKIIDNQKYLLKRTVELALNNADIIADCCRNQAINPPVIFPGQVYKNMISRRFITIGHNNYSANPIEVPVDAVIRYDRNMKSTVVEKKQSASISDKQTEADSMLAATARIV